MPTCIIQSCPYWKLGRPQRPDITLHSFPKSARRIRNWLEQTEHKFKDIDAFVGRILEMRKDGDYRICSGHFTNNCYMPSGNTRVLKANAMPTIFPVGRKLFQEAATVKAYRKPRLVCRRNLVESPNLVPTNAATVLVLTKADAITQTEDFPPTTHQAVQTEDFCSKEDQCTNTPLTCQLPERVTPCNDKYCYNKDLTWNDTPGSQRSDEDTCHVNKKILNLTLEIIFLLTGERPDWGGEGRNLSPSIKAHTPLIAIEKNNKQKMIDVLQKIIELLTEEVPIRSQDVTVYFSMEEWTYLEGHKDLYKDIMMETWPLCISTDFVLAKNFARTSKHLPESNNCELQFPSVCVKNEENLPYSKISTKCHKQMSLHYMKEECMLAEEHLPTPELSPPTHHPPRTIYSKEGQHSFKDQPPKSDLHSPSQHTHSTTTYVKQGPILEKKPLNLNISSATEHRQFRTIGVKKESLSDKEHTQSMTMQTTEGTLSDEEHLPSTNILKTHTHRIQPGINMDKEVFISREDLFSSKTSTPVHHTEPSFEEQLPHEMDYTTIIIDKESISSDDDHHSPSVMSISQDNCNFFHASKGHLSSEEEHLNYSNQSLPSSPKQHIPVHINNTVLFHQQHLQQHPDIPTRPEDLVEKVPMFYKGGVYTDKSALGCDRDLKATSLNLFPTASERSFLSEPDFTDRSLFCPECGKSFTDKARVEVHLRSHWGEKPYCCSICLKGFRSKSKLAVHETMHSGEKPYACSECGKCFAQNSYLQRHIRGHTGEKPFPCSICGKCFTCRSDMLKHEITHTGARPHPCAMCGKRFTKKSHLNRHMRIHTGEKPFCCPDCGRSFGCNSDMVSHQRIHQGVKPFSCSECGKCFLRKQDAMRHQSTHRQ